MQMPVILQFILRSKLQQSYDVLKKIQRQKKFFVMYLTLGSLEHFSITQLPGEKTVLWKYSKAVWVKNHIKHNRLKNI